MPTAPMEPGELVVQQSSEIPGQFMAQVFVEEITETDPKLTLEGKPQRKFVKMQYSSWHDRPGAAIGDLTAKIELEGFLTRVV